MICTINQYTGLHKLSKKLGLKNIICSVSFPFENTWWQVYRSRSVLFAVISHKSHHAKNDLHCWAHQLYWNIEVRYPFTFFVKVPNYFSTFHIVFNMWLIISWVWLPRNSWNNALLLARKQCAAYITLAVWHKLLNSSDFKYSSSSKRSSCIHALHYLEGPSWCCTNHFLVISLSDYASFCLPQEYYFLEMTLSKFCYFVINENFPSLFSWHLVLWG